MELSETYKILQEITRAIAASPDGISSGEIVKRFGIKPRTVSKYIRILEDAGVPLYEERKRYYMDENYFTGFALTPEEGEFLYLILKRSLILHSERWRTLQSLLSKLSNKMTSPLADYLTSRIDWDSGERPSDRHFKLLAQAKRERREAWVEYHPLNRPEPSVWLIRPFQFTSNLLSDGLYVLCHGSRDHQSFIPLSLRFDRILNVRLTTQRFELLEQARFANTLETMWGVWHSERDPVEVQLRFEPRHYARLLETTWHPSQQIWVDNNNYVYYSVEISEPDEIVPWIRSWGSGVVVLAPELLRQRIINTLRRQMRAYGLSEGKNPEQSPAHYLWAKYDRATGDYHLLIYHMLDVAAVAWQMWEWVISQSQRDWLAEILGTDHRSIQGLLAWLAALHDIGKATPAFQKKARPLYDALLSTGIQDEADFGDFHGTLSAVILFRLLVESGVDKRVSRNIAQVIGGHHGEWINSTDENHARGGVGQQPWRDIQNTLFSTLKDVLAVDDITLPSDPTARNIFATFLSGFISVCDWIGSNETHFPYESSLIDAPIYFERALEQALKALNETGWIGWKPVGDRLTFEQVFSFHPNIMQQAVINTCHFSEAPPRLIVIEYLTGEGKTEIALYLADLIINLFAQCGIYVAMPTQATSNQMFGRVGAYLQARYPHQTINMQLIHGQAEQQSDFRRIQAQPYREGNDNGLTAEGWFQNRRRSLLAPFAVGTIDQAMLSVLQTQHHFVRQYGLSHKVVVFDEIHAYDTYMNQIIERLITWLAALNSPMIMLSATLPKTTRKALLRHAGAADVEFDVPYPRLTVVNQDGLVQVYPLPAPPTRTLFLHQIDVDNLAEWLAPIYTQGGCIAVICNTVDEAIAVALELRLSPEIGKEGVLLFHARTLPAWRKGTEATVLRHFSKGGDRPERMILVATQIIEQSLDLDFDLIITRIAPIDLLIQRAGRLHRHGYRNRPAHLQTPTLIIRQSQLNEDGVPDFGVDGAIYAKYILLRTWYSLRDRAELHIPDEIDALMEFVYAEWGEWDAESPAFRQALTDAYDEMTMDGTGQAFKGAQYRIGAPDDRALIGDKSASISDDDERNIATRDIAPGIDIICFRGAHGLEGLPTPIDRTPTQDEVNRLLQFRVTIRKKAVLKALGQLPLEQSWQRKPQLRYARPVVFENNLYHIPNSNFLLRLTPFYGLEIIEEEA